MELILVSVNNATQDVTKPTNTIIKLNDPSHPQMQHLYDVITTTLPHLTSHHKFILYWRLRHDAFLPIYDYVSLKAALSLMVDRKIYVVEKNGKSWCSDKHPMSVHKGRPSDVALLSRLPKTHERAREDLGYSVGDSVNMRLVMNILKGIPKGKDIVEEDVTNIRSKESKKGKEKDKGSKVEKKGKKKGKK